MMIGYARNNHDQEDIDRQTAELSAAGCECVWKELGSAMNDNRCELKDMLNHARQGDTIVVTSIHRLVRSHQDLALICKQLDERGIGLQILDIHMDSNLTADRWFYQFVEIMSALERDQIRNRINAGLNAAKVCGKRLGRPPVDRDIRATARALKAQGLSYGAICKELGISQATYYRIIKEKTI